MTTYARRLGLFSGTMAVVGGIVGGGIFRTPAAVAERVGSSGLILAVWVAGGVVALVGAAACIYIMVGLPAHAWERFGLWLALGLLLYFVYGYRHSRLRAANGRGSGPV